MKINAHYYQQFDADYSLDVPAEGYAGWQTGEIEIDPARTAVVVMHAWDCGAYEEFPGWWRAIEYIPRSHEICRTVFPPLLAAVRAAGLNLFHVVGGRKHYYENLPGHKRAVELAGPEPPAPERIESDPVLERLHAFHADHVNIGPDNRDDVRRGFERIGFPAEACPRDDEGVAENAHQLFALCKDAGVNHLVYMGFAINWCLLLSPGGMADMHHRGIMCSALRQATTAVENRETAREELCKELGLWRVSLSFGFVFDVDDFVAGISGE